MDSRRTSRRENEWTVWRKGWKAYDGKTGGISVSHGVTAMIALDEETLLVNSLVLTEGTLGEWRYLFQQVTGLSVH